MSFKQSNIVLCAITLEEKTCLVLSQIQMECE